MADHDDHASAIEYESTRIAMYETGSPDPDAKDSDQRGKTIIHEANRQVVTSQKVVKSTEERSETCKQRRSSKLLEVTTQSTKTKSTDVSSQRTDESSTQTNIKTKHSEESKLTTTETKAEEYETITLSQHSSSGPNTDSGRWSEEDRNSSPSASISASNRSSSLSPNKSPGPSPTALSPHWSLDVSAPHTGYVLPTFVLFILTNYQRCSESWLLLMDRFNVNFIWGQQSPDFALERNQIFR